VPGVVKGVEAGELGGDGVLDFRLDLHAAGVGVAEALAEDEADGALDVVAPPARFPDLSCDIPCGSYRKAGGPKNGAEIGPDAGILMGEHHDLQAVVRHMVGHG
jgi:hypothetical protein